MNPEMKTAASILAQISKLSALRPDQPPPEARDSYRRAAAVIAVVDDPQKLRPADAGWENVPPNVIASDLVPASLGGRSSAGVLQHDLRRAALRELGSRDRMIAALKANPHERTGLVQHQFERYLAGDAAPIDDQTHEELEATLQALIWLDGIIDGLPSIESVRARIALLELMGPFEVLAGDAVFRGRKADLDSLRSYVGVLEPQTLRARFREKLPWGKPDPLAALSVSGPGGVGKSALIARFVLEHWRMPSEVRVPFAYLDLERPALNVAEPTTLVDEMLRQIVLQFPDHTAFKTLHDTFSGDLATIDSGSGAERGRKPGASGKTVSGRATLAQVALEDLLGLLETRLGPRPYLIVLDTFELVQYRGEQQAFPLWSLLARMQAARPFLRVVVSGRAPVTTLRLADKPPASLPLGELDRESAVAIVQAMGIADASVAATIVRQVGGVPLSLKLAVALVKRSPGADVSVRSAVWMRAADEVVQGQLFDRILVHIQNPELQRLAHPGLVLRRVTPETIFYILREPCKLAVRTLDDARVLFEQLRREISLVSSDDPDGSVVHRRDLREVMLKLLRQKDPAVARDVSERAVRWYASQPDKRARMEEAYHRLLLGQPIERSTISDPDVRASLQTYIADLPLRSQRLLATYGLRVDPQILERASREEKEAVLAEQVEQLLPHQSGIPSALSLLRGYGKPVSDSPLWRSWVRVGIERSEDSTAFIDAESGLTEATAARNHVRVCELLSEKAWLCELAKRDTELDETLELLNRYVERLDVVPGRVQYHLQSARRRGVFGERRLDPLWAASMMDLFGKSSPQDLFALMPATAGFWNVMTTLPAIDLSPIVELIAEIESPFGTARFEDDGPMVALESATRAAYSARSNPRSDSYRALAKSLEALVAAWPYRNLRMYPSESHRAYMSA
jgi:hypothetical protein